VIPVALLSTANFDATTLNVLTTTFGLGAATEAHEMGHIEDANGDGVDDLVLHFRTQETGINSAELCITGETTDGTPIQGCDTITLKEGNDSEEKPQDDGKDKGNEGKGNDKKK